MISRIPVLAVLLLLAPAIAAETIYKYRRADGRMIYSNRPIAGVELIEAFEYQPAKPVAARADTPKADAAGERRIKAYLASLESAWNVVQDANKALAAAEERLRAGVVLQEGETQGMTGPAKPVSPEVGGPQKPAPAEAGGPSGAASPAVGGPMGNRRGGRGNAEYLDRMAALEADVRAARTRLDAALRSYNQLR